MAHGDIRAPSSGPRWAGIYKVRRLIGSGRHGRGLRRRGQERREGRHQGPARQGRAGPGPRRPLPPRGGHRGADQVAPRRGHPRRGQGPGRPALDRLRAARRARGSTSACAASSTSRSPRSRRSSTTRSRGSPPRTRRASSTATSSPRTSSSRSGKLTAREIASDESEERTRILDFGVSKMRGAQGPAQRAVADGVRRHPRELRLHGARSRCAAAPASTSGPTSTRSAPSRSARSSGRLPFEGQNALTLIALKLDREPPTLSSTTGDEWPAAIERFLAKMMARDREKRFANARRGPRRVAEGLPADGQRPAPQAAHHARPRGAHRRHRPHVHRRLERLEGLGRSAPRCEAASSACACRLRDARARAISRRMRQSHRFAFSPRERRRRLGRSSDPSDPVDPARPRRAINATDATGPLVDTRPPSTTAR